MNTDNSYVINGQEILVVDDSPTQVEQLKYFLERNHYKVAPAYNANEALEYLNKHKPLLVITDIMMPGMNGYELCRKIKANTKNSLPVILLTSLSDPDYIVKGLDCGADNFLVKPYEEKYLVSMIQSIHANQELRKHQQTQFGVDIYFGGKKHTITSNRTQILDLLISTYEVAIQKNYEFEKVTRQLCELNEQLEEKVKERTKELTEEINRGKYLEQTLRESEESYRLLFENSLDAVLLTSPDGEILNVNSAAEKIFGLALEEFKQLGRNGVLDTTDPNFHTALEERKRTGKFTGELIGIRKDGSKFPMEISTAIYRDRNNELRSSMLIHDISDRKRAQEDLIKAKEHAEQSDKLKTEFLAQMSHEIRSPINVIISFANLLKDGMGYNPPAEVNEYFSGIESAGRRLIRTIDLIINISELHVGTYEASWENLDLFKDVIANLKNEYTNLAKTKNLQFNLVKKTPRASVYGDKYSIFQIFSNLIDNAIKYTHKGSIDVVLDKSNENNIVVSVTDTGIGISEEFKSKLFEPFMQEERGYSRKFEGNGLGLALVKKYCDLNKAKINIESEKGVGTKITVAFPKS